MTQPTVPPLATDIKNPLWKQAVINLYTALLKGSSVAPSAVTVTASPFVYTNSSAYSVDMVLNGGAVSALSFKRYINNVAGTAVTIPATSAIIRLSQGDSLTVTYSAAPTITVIPR